MQKTGGCSTLLYRGWLVFRKPTLEIHPALTSGYDIVARISMVFTRNDYYGK